MTEASTGPTASTTGRLYPASSSGFADGSTSRTAAGLGSDSAREEAGRPDELLDDVLEALRRQSPSAGAASSKPMQSLNAQSPLDARSRPTSASITVLDEIQTRLDEATAGGLLSLPDADLAGNLVSLLSCLRRLSDLAIPNDTALESAAASSHRNAHSAASTGQTLDATLERASALLTSHRSPPSVAGMLRDVETAERELLWGRVDDLAEQVQALSRARAAGFADLPAGSSQTARSSDTVCTNGELSARLSLDCRSISDAPPGYSQQPRSADGLNSPPAYKFGDLSLEGDVVSDVKRTDEKAAGAVRPAASPRTRKISTAHSEKMQRDLDSVTEAIERLYLAAPQLANQRVEPDRRAQRERQLAALGNAIERLNQGRFEDQRAAPASPASRQHVSPSSSRTRAEKASPGVRAEDAAFERMLEQIDRAARRTLANQRVEMR